MLLDLELRYVLLLGAFGQILGPDPQKLTLQIILCVPVADLGAELFNRDEALLVDQLVVELLLLLFRGLELYLVQELHEFLKLRKGLVGGPELVQRRVAILNEFAQLFERIQLLSLLVHLFLAGQSPVLVGALCVVLVLAQAPRLFRVVLVLVIHVLLLILLILLVVLVPIRIIHSVQILALHFLLFLLLAHVVVVAWLLLLLACLRLVVRSAVLRFRPSVAQLVVFSDDDNDDDNNEIYQNVEEAIAVSSCTNQLSLSCQLSCEYERHQL